MKKFGLVLTMLAIAGIGFSQKEKVKFGMQAGVNIASLHSKITYASFGTSYSTKIPFDNIVGITGGVQAEIHLAKQFYLQPELSYSQLGAKSVYPNADSTTSSGDLTVKGILHYLVLPVLVKYKLSNTGASIFLGPQVCYLLGVTNKINSTTINEKDNSNYKTDLAAIFGAEYYLPMGLGISARYQLGFQNIQNPDYVDLNSFPTDVAPKSIFVRNNALTVTIGYRF